VVDLAHVSTRTQAGADGGDADESAEDREDERPREHPLRAAPRQERGDRPNDQHDADDAFGGPGLRHERLAERQGERHRHAEVQRAGDQERGGFHDDEHADRSDHGRASSSSSGERSPVGVKRV